MCRSRPAVSNMVIYREDAKRGGVRGWGWRETRPHASVCVAAAHTMCTKIVLSPLLRPAPLVITANHTYRHW